MNRVLAFKQHLRPVCVGPDLVFLLGEREQFLLRGRLYAVLAPLLDGSRSTGSLIKELAGQISAAEVLYAISMLVEKGYLVEATPDVAPEAAAFWQSLDIDPRVAVHRLASAPVTVEALSGIDPQPLIDALQAAGVRVQAESGIHVLLTDDYLDSALDAFNRRARTNGTRWMLFKPTGVEPWIGPMFRPDVGFCWACLAHRIRSNRPVEVFLQRRMSGSSAPPSIKPPQVSLPGSEQAARSLAALALARWIAGGQEGSLNENLVSFDMPQMRLTEHPVMKRPQCPVCGDGDLLRRRAEGPLLLESRPKNFTNDGGHRITAPNQTYEAGHARYVSPITGIISAIAPAPGVDLSVRPVYGATYPVCPQKKSPALSDFYQASGGKGRTAAQSRASALGEAVERWSSQFQGDEPRISARIADLGAEAVHPCDLLHYSEAQYRARADSPPEGPDARYRVPEPFDERVEIEWTPVWSFTKNCRLYLPTAYCFNNYPLAPASNIFPNDSNGNAAGNCLEEAIVQGFLELVERDSIALWWYSRSRRSAVDLQSFSEPYFQELEDHYRAIGWEMWVLDITSDLGIPAFVALAGCPQQRLLVGFGCHFEARLGVQRALTELNQLLAADRAMPKQWEGVSLQTQTYLFPDWYAPRRGLSFYPPFRSQDLRDDVISCVERAAAVGLETLVLDQSRPDVGLSTVKVTVPGLRHYWPRLGPGRLYDVPVQLGWRSEPLREEDLNPMPVFW